MRRDIKTAMRVVSPIERQKTITCFSFYTGVSDTLTPRIEARSGTCSVFPAPLADIRAVCAATVLERSS
jgi:hypothetical protein